MLRSLRRARWSSVAFALLAVGVAGAACGGGGGGGSPGSGGDDSGTASDAASGGPEAGADTGSLVHDSGSSSGGQDATIVPGGDAASDATFSFDGFARPDGWSADAASCPDDDNDGWTSCGGDCNDHDSQVNPCAFDTNDPNDPVGHDGIDNDCDGTVDNLIMCEPTAQVGTFDPNPVDYANASDLCDNPLCPRLVQTKAIWYGPSPGKARRITGHMGTQGEFNPKLGKAMSFLSSGTAEDSTDTPAYAGTCPGTDFQTTFTNPMPLPAAQNTNPCGTGVDESTVSVHDYTELRMTIKAPVNAGSYSFDFAFFSEEFPYYVCQGFNDTFLAIQWSQQYPSGYQIAYDANGHRINVNNGFFQDCKACTNCVPGYTFTFACPNGLGPLAGTFYDVALGTDSSGIQCNNNWGSGGTDWLTTTSPINPGETFTLSWIVFDEHDGILDSSAILDHFHWHSTTLGSPVTAR